MRVRTEPRPVIKTADELDKMRAANRLARAVLAEMGRRIKPGVTTMDLETEARRMTEAAGAKGAFYQYRVGDKVYPYYLCTSINDCVVHGFPNERPLEPGDIVSIDYGCVLDGFVGDTAWTWSVGEPSPTARHLMDVTREALYRGIAMAQPGRRVFDVAREIQSYCESEGCGVVRALVGHGVGRRMHEPPQVPNYAAPESRRDRLRPGMTICIEPMITAGTWEVYEPEGKWDVLTRDGSLAAHYEHCIAILDDGPEILSLPEEI